MTDPEWLEKDDGEKEEELVILDPDHVCLLIYYYKDVPLKNINNQ